MLYPYSNDHHYIVTSGKGHLDIDAYACCLGLVDLLTRKGLSSEFVSGAPLNASVPEAIQKSYSRDQKIFPSHKQTKYIVCDVSEPDFFDPVVKSCQVFEVIDHHFGFESYWQSKADYSDIRPVAACASLIAERFSKTSLQPGPDIANLLMLAILSNSLNFSLRLTGATDRDAFSFLCDGDVNKSEEMAKKYFSGSQKQFFKDPEKNLMLDMKKTILHDTRVNFFQTECWSMDLISVEKLFELACHSDVGTESSVLNVVSVRDKCSYFFSNHQRLLDFMKSLYPGAVAVSPQGLQFEIPMLRKEIIRDFQS